MKHYKSPSGYYKIFLAS